jgi:hypothetical protein
MFSASQQAPLADALEWYLAHGVDVALESAPVDRFAAPPPMPQPSSAGHAGSSPALHACADRFALQRNGGRASGYGRGETGGP